ncbi:MAG: site-specific integrase [Caulobacteraceae bacterium]|nr:site-specific integrase [Caulobacteraceae bacterium]
MRHRVAKHKRGFVAVIYRDDGTRHRVALKSSDRFAATAEAADIVRRLKERAPKESLTVGQIVEMYFEQSEAIWKDVDRFHWRHGQGAFGQLPPSDVTERKCRDYADASRNKPGSIRKVLSILRAALRWAEKKGIIDKAPHIWLPPAPPPKDRRLTRDEFTRLASECTAPHLIAWLWLARYTAARAGALLSLRWEQVDFEGGRIHLGGAGRQKRRAVVPMHPDLALCLAIWKDATSSGYVIEFGGKPVKSIKRSFRAACDRAGLDKSVTPHTLRHTAASWMAEAGIPMSEIAAVLGHRDSRTTERIYARMSPEYLQKAVRSLG